MPRWRSPVLSTLLVVPAGGPDRLEPDVVGPSLPVTAEPIIDGGGDRLVVVTRPASATQPSATLLAAQQLSDEADRYSRAGRRTMALTADRRRRSLRALVDQRRAERSGTPVG